MKKDSENIKRVRRPQSNRKRKHFKKISPEQWAEKAIKEVGFAIALSAANACREGAKTGIPYPFWQMAFNYLKKRVPPEATKILERVQSAKPGTEINF